MEAVPHPAQGSRRPFTVVFEYAATGEGVRHHVLLVNASDAADALARYHTAIHLAPEYHAWHERGVTVQDGLQPEVLRRYFSAGFLKELEEQFIYNGELLFQWAFRSS